MAFDIIGHNVAQAEGRLVEADRYEERGDARMSRQSARIAAHYYEAAAKDAFAVSFEAGRKYLELALAGYLRGRSHVYVQKTREWIEQVDLQIQTRDRRHQEFMAGLDARLSVPQSGGDT